MIYFRLFFFSLGPQDLKFLAVENSLCVDVATVLETEPCKRPKWIMEKPKTPIWPNIIVAKNVQVYRISAAKEGESAWLPPEDSWKMSAGIHFSKTVLLCSVFPWRSLLKKKTGTLLPCKWLFWSRVRQVSDPVELHLCLVGKSKLGHM